MGKYFSLLFAGVMAWMMSSCDVFPRINMDKYWRCETDDDCGGGCKCFNGQICVHADPDRDAESCSPCVSPDADCDDDPVTGCETDLNSDVENCGECGKACENYQECMDGQCVGCHDADKDGYEDDQCGGDDCNDANPDIHPNALEICGNGVDEDCNNADPPCGCEEKDDEDEDGYYNAKTCGGTDCDDLDPGINPGKSEITCNNVDENCNGMADDAPDEDADGYDICDSAKPGDTDGQPSDCDDADDSVNPGADEIKCNNVDENCVQGDDSSIEECGNNIDEDCSGKLDDPDLDHDGFIAFKDSFGAICGGTDCDDGNSGINPNQHEITCNGIDENCNGLQDDDPDFDNDGFSVCGPADAQRDCDDFNPSVNPGAQEAPGEVINGVYTCFDCIDNDCDGFVDCADSVCKRDSPGCDVCTNHDGDGWAYCPGPSFCNDCDESNAGANPGEVEICGNSIDEDCDGQLDYIDLDGDAYPAPIDAGGNLCTPDLPNSLEFDCNDYDNRVHPGAEEKCDGLDNDCSDFVDDLDRDNDAHSPCLGEDCDDSDPDVNSDSTEICSNFKDDNCDEKIDCADDDCVMAVSCPQSCQDQDGDGWADCGQLFDCIDSDPRIHPGQLPLCNDNNNSCQALETQAMWLAGSFDSGNQNGIVDLARFDGPTALAPGFDTDNNPCVFVADTNNNSIRKVDLANNVVSTVAGNENDNDGDFVPHGTIDEVGLDSPSGLMWFRTSGQVALLVTDTGNSAIRLVNIGSADPHGDINYIVTLTGGTEGYEDGFLTMARFNHPRGLTTDDLGNIYIADTDNHCIRKISYEGWVSTFSGLCEESGDVQGQSLVARYTSPTDIVYIGSGAFLVTDTGNSKIRYLDIDGAMSTVVGGVGSGYMDGYTADAKINKPRQLAVDWLHRIILVADSDNQVIRSLQYVEQMNDVWTGTFAGGGNTSVQPHEASGACDANLHSAMGVSVYSEFPSYVKIYFTDGNQILFSEWFF